MKSKSAPEEMFALQLRAERIPYEREVKFHPTRKWRLDFLIAGCLAVEIDGWGRHQRFVGFANDCEKNAEALVHGITILRVTPQQVKSGKAIDWLKRLLGG